MQKSVRVRVPWWLESLPQKHNDRISFLPDLCGFGSSSIVLLSQLLPSSLHPPPSIPLPLSSLPPSLMKFSAATVRSGHPLGDSFNFYFYFLTAPCWPTFQCLITQYSMCVSIESDRDFDICVWHFHLLPMSHHIRLFCLCLKFHLHSRNRNVCYSVCT